MATKVMTSHDNLKENFFRITLLSNNDLLIESTIFILIRIFITHY